MIDDKEKGNEGEEPKKSFFDSFAPLFNRLQELHRRFRPGAPYRWKKHSYTKRPLAARKSERRRKSKVARKARRQNRRSK